MRCFLARLLAVSLLLGSSSLRAAEHWPRFRGADATGVGADHAGLPLTWTVTENVRWAADVPGWGWSCPVVWGDRVFLTTVVADETNVTPSKGLYLGEGVRQPARGVHHWMVYCFDLKTGQTLWKHEAHTGKPQVPRHPKSTYAAETATTDGQRLYVLFGDLGLYCYDLDGKPLWSQLIEPQKTMADYGAAASPVVHDGQVFVVYDNRESSWIAAFDAKTGKERWRQERDETHSWATPLVWQNEQRTELVVPGRKRNRSYSLQGDLLWEFDGRMSNLVIPSPFAAHGLCYIASGYVGDAHRPTFAIKPGGQGNLAAKEDFADNEHIAWYQGTSSSYNPSQIVYGDYLYTLYDRGFLTCHDAKTGEEIYGKQRFTPRGSFTASPWAYNGYLFFLSEDGLTYVVKAGPKFEIVARNDLAELCMACPAVVNDALLIRTASKLYCLTKGSKLDAAAAARMAPRRKATAAVDIWTAAREGQLDLVKRLLASGIAVNAKQRGSGATPLNTAVLYGQQPVVKLLLEKGADVTIANRDGNTALHLAAFFGEEPLVQLLLAKQASVTVKNGRGETPADVVAAEWSEELAGIYRRLENTLGRQLDLEKIQRARPQIAKRLAEQAAKMTVEEQTKVHRLKSRKRAVLDAFAYLNRIEMQPEESEATEDLVGRIFGRLANQEGRILLKLPPSMDRQAYIGWKTFLQYEGTQRVGNCAACHALPDFTDAGKHVVTPGMPAVATPSLRNLKMTSKQLRQAMLKKIAVSRQRQSGQADDVDPAYAKMKLDATDVPSLVAFLQLLTDVSDKEFRKLILEAQLLDTSQEIE